MSGINSHELRAARDRFQVLLERPTNELEWQLFFSDHPYVLSMSLPLRIEPTDIVPLGRHGKAEPDIIFYPHNTRPVPFYGVVELKRPDSKILTVTRSNVILFSRDAETAIEQARLYAITTKTLIPIERNDKLLFLGNRVHLFVIMGSSQELITKLGNEIYKEKVEKRLPENLQLIPYDILLQLFESQIPPQIYCLSQALEEQFELTGRVEKAGFSQILNNVPEKGNYLVVEFYESNSGDKLMSGACVVVKKLSEAPTSEMHDLRWSMNTTYPRVRVLVKPHKGNIVYSDPYFHTIYEAISDFQEL